MQWRGSGFVVLSWWWLVATVVAVGVLVIAFVDLRWGGRLMAAGFVVGAVVRLVARPARKAGGLNVRSRGLDVAILLTLAVGLLVASATVNLSTSDAAQLRGRLDPLTGSPRTGGAPRGMPHGRERARGAVPVGRRLCGERGVGRWCRPSRVR